MDQQKQIAELIEKARQAMSKIQTYNQSQIDRLVRGIGRAAYDHAEELARLAVDETGYGRWESKVVKNRRTAMAAWYFLKDKKSVGVVNIDEQKCLATIAKPAGVVACITPTTNPNATIVVNCMHVLKGKNAAIIAPHPKSIEASLATVRILNQAILELGGPENLIQIIEQPSTELTQDLMKEVDVVVATGGAAMVKAAYSSGKPSFGVGQGNVQVIVDEDFEDFNYIAEETIGNRSYDFGMPCTGEQAIFVPASKKDGLIKAFKEYGSFYIDDQQIVQRFREELFNEKNVLRKEFFGQPAWKVAQLLGVEVPKSTEILLLEVEKFAQDEILSKEILCPLIKIYTYNDFAEAVAGAKRNLLMEGAGHSAVIYSHDEEHIAYFSEEIPVCRVDVNVSAVAGSGSPYDSGMDPTMSNGCGFWGNNSLSGPLTYQHLLNYTNVIRRIPNIVPPTPAEVWD